MSETPTERSLYDQRAAKQLKLGLLFSQHVFGVAGEAISPDAPQLFTSDPDTAVCDKGDFGIEHVGYLPSIRTFKYFLELGMSIHQIPRWSIRPSILSLDKMMAAQNATYCGITVPKRAFQAYEFGRVLAGDETPPFKDSLHPSDAQIIENVMFSKVFEKEPVDSMAAMMVSGGNLVDMEIGNATSAIEGMPLQWKHHLDLARDPKRFELVDVPADMEFDLMYAFEHSLKGDLFTHLILPFTKIKMNVNGLLFKLFHSTAYANTKKPLFDFAFHGTRGENVPSICKNGFNRTSVIANGHAMGVGTYFAEKSIVSINNRYTPMDDNHHRWFIGSIVAAESFFQPEARTGVTTDLGKVGRLKDHATKSTIYVTYKDNQAYPMYIYDLDFTKMLEFIATVLEAPLEEARTLVIEEVKKCADFDPMGKRPNFFKAFLCSVEELDGRAFIDEETKVIKTQQLAGFVLTQIMSIGMGNLNTYLGKRGLQPLTVPKDVDLYVSMLEARWLKNTEKTLTPEEPLPACIPEASTSTVKPNVAATMSGIAGPSASPLGMFNMPPNTMVARLHGICDLYQPESPYLCLRDAELGPASANALLPGYPSVKTKNGSYLPATFVKKSNYAVVQHPYGTTMYPMHHIANKTLINHTVYSALYIPGNTKTVLDLEPWYSFRADVPGYAPGYFLNLPNTSAHQNRIATMVGRELKKPTLADSMVPLSPLDAGMVCAANSKGECHVIKVDKLKEVMSVIGGPQAIQNKVMEQVQKVQPPPSQLQAKDVKTLGVVGWAPEDLNVFVPDPVNFAEFKKSPEFKQHPLPYMMIQDFDKWKIKNKIFPNSTGADAEKAAVNKSPYYTAERLMPRPVTLYNPTTSVSSTTGMRVMCKVNIAAGAAGAAFTPAPTLNATPTPPPPKPVVPRSTFQLKFQLPSNPVTVSPCKLNMTNFTLVDVEEAVCKYPSAWAHIDSRWSEAQKESFKDMLMDKVVKSVQLSKSLSGVKQVTLDGLQIIGKDRLYKLYRSVSSRMAKEGVDNTEGKLKMFIKGIGNYTHSGDFSGTAQEKHTNVDNFYQITLYKDLNRLTFAHLIVRFASPGKRLDYEASQKEIAEFRANSVLAPGDRPDQTGESRVIVKNKVEEYRQMYRDPPKNDDEVVNVLGSPVSSDDNTDDAVGILMSLRSPHGNMYYSESDTSPGPAKRGRPAKSKNGDGAAAKKRKKD